MRKSGESSPLFLRFFAVVLKIDTERKGEKLDGLFYPCYYFKGRIELQCVIKDRRDC